MRHDRTNEAQRVARWRVALLGVAFFAVGWPGRVYRGPGSAWTMGHWWDLFGPGVVWCAGRLLFPRASRRAFGLTLWALLMSNELLQAVPGVWLDRLRSTRVGSVVLGWNFDPWDLVVISAGVLLAAAAEAAFAARRSP